ncbi:MAG: bifunctional methionine sulfoxide reductase B/A protein [Planctomycetes bacterium]|nr:bifunctional methionine sulfoxide reductase B/A protein [Planctomycetota bacterium]
MRNPCGLAFFFTAFVFVLVGLGACAPAGAEPPAAPSSLEGSKEMVRVRLLGPDGKLGEPLDTAKLVLPDEEWMKRLTPEQFRIVRGKGTERAFCGGLLHEKGSGVFVCVGCGLPLFESRSKFESGTGWPSFFRPIAAENVREESDESHDMVRTELLCRRCDGHLGHVFPDGPPPTGRRYCLNSESLRFVLTDAAKPADAAAGAAAVAVAPEKKSRAELVVAGGCFWCVEAVFDQIEGVLDVQSGYAGGAADTANYKAVCTGNTGHAEAVKLVYDPAKVSFEELLKVHFATHDPTTLNRQGNDEGTQYRSAVFYANEEERQLASAFLADMTAAKVLPRPIVTTLEPLKAFYPAEAYHQDFVCRNPYQPYVRAIALPKVEKVREKFKDMLKGKGGAAGGAPGGK